MNAAYYLKLLERDIHSAVFATVDEHGNPATCVIDIMRSDVLSDRERQGFLCPPEGTRTRVRDRFLRGGHDVFPVCHPKLHRLRAVRFRLSAGVYRRFFDAGRTVAAVRRSAPRGQLKRA